MRADTIARVMLAAGPDGSVPALFAQTPAAHQHPAAATAKPPAGMEAKCQAMMAEKQTR